jgi:Fe2+ or Zn2+ uptake regulation protein
MMQRSTRQLQATLDAVAVSTDHPTADQILARVRRRLPQVSLGTVYRNLEKLRDQGRVQIVRLGDGVARYDAMVEHHDHFVCKGCGVVIDLEQPSRPDIYRLQRAGLVVHSHSTAFHGLCAGCAARAPQAQKRTRGRRPPGARRTDRREVRA